MSFQVGQNIVCVCESESRPDKTVTTINGQIYTVRDVHPASDAVRLVEIINAPFKYIEGFHEAYYAASLFRPVDESFGNEVEDAIEKMMEPETVSV